MHILRACCWLSIALLTGCGWQLQGMHRIPENVVPLYLDLTDIHSPFAESLTQRLQQAGVDLTDDRNRAQAILRVNKDSSGHRVSSVSALNEPQQYDVYYEVEYRLDTRAPGSTNLLAPQTLNAARIMTYDKNLGLAKQREELFLRDTLATELADEVMRKLSMLPHGEPVPATE
jgi:LPS-assembly lipoprotein